MLMIAANANEVRALLSLGFEMVDEFETHSVLFCKCEAMKALKGWRMPVTVLSLLLSP